MTRWIKKKKLFVNILYLSAKFLLPQDMYSRKLVGGHLNFYVGLGKQMNRTGYLSATGYIVTSIQFSSISRA